MYEELVKRLKDKASGLDYDGWVDTAASLEEAADAIEERDRYVLTLQHEMMAEAESHIALVERLNKQVEELQKEVAHWQRELTKSMCGETLAELEKPHWIPVTERFPEEKTSVLVYRRGDRLQPTMRIDVCPYLGDGIFCLLNVTHWMPLPEPPKEEAE